MSVLGGVVGLELRCLATLIKSIIDLGVEYKKLSSMRTADGKVHKVDLVIKDELDKDIGFEKIVLKQCRMTGYFLTNQDSSYFQSAKFTAVLEFVKTNPGTCSMRENNDKLTITFNNINSIGDGLTVLQPILESFE